MAEVHILSYFSIETDLAAEMRSWPEFRSGAGYVVDLASSDLTETVSVVLVKAAADEHAYVRVRASVPGPLFERVTRVSPKDAPVVREGRAAFEAEEFGGECRIEYRVPPECGRQDRVWATGRPADLDTTSSPMAGSPA